MSKLKQKTIHTAKDLLAVKTQQANLKYEQLELLDKLSYDIASILGLTNKEGEPDPKKVKGSLLKEAILVSKLGKKNAMEEKYSTFESYLNLIEKDNSLSDLVEMVSDKEDAITDAKNEYNAIKKEVVLEEEEHEELENKNVEEKDWITFTETVVKLAMTEVEKELKETYTENKTGEAPMEKEAKAIVEIFNMEEIERAIKK